MSEAKNKLQDQVQRLLDETENLQNLHDDKLTQVERLTERITELQKQLQEYTQRNADLMKEVSLQ